VSWGWACFLKLDFGCDEFRDGGGGGVYISSRISVLVFWGVWRSFILLNAGGGVGVLVCTV